MSCWGLALSILVFLYLFINEKIGYQCVFLVNVDILGQALLNIAYIKQFKYKHVLNIWVRTNFSYGSTSFK